MEGFLSTTHSERMAIKLYGRMNKNAIIEISVETEKLGGELDWGFASIEHCSHLKS